jgi:hypothetical protein
MRDKISNLQPHQIGLLKNTAVVFCIFLILGLCELVLELFQRSINEIIAPFTFLPFHLLYFYSSFLYGISLEEPCLMGPLILIMILSLSIIIYSGGRKWWSIFNGEEYDFSPVVPYSAVMLVLFALIACVVGFFVHIASSG